MRIRLKYVDTDSGQVVEAIYNWNDFVEWVQTWGDYVGPTSFTAEKVQWRSTAGSAAQRTRSGLRRSPPEGRQCSRLSRLVATSWSVGGCKAEGYVDLDVTCAHCSGSDLWRWPNRSMDTNTRRWFCRDCHHVTECHNEAVMYQSHRILPVVQSRGRTIPNCHICSSPTVMYDRDRMTTAWCQNTTGTHQQTYPLHKQKRADIKKKGDPAVNSSTIVGTNGNITYNMTTTTNTHNGSGWKPRRRSFQGDPRDEDQQGHARHRAPGSHRRDDGPQRDGGAG